MVKIEEVDDQSQNASAKPTQENLIQKTRARSGDKEQYHLKYTDVHNVDKENEEGGSGIAEAYQLLAVAAGGICYFYRNKYAAWICLFFFYSGVINHSHHNMVQQGTTSIGLVVIAFVQSYVAPDPEEIERRRKA